MDNLLNDMPARVIGHRGIPSLAPENSLEGVRKARELGVDWVEMDVTLSPDGTPVMSHDPLKDAAGLRRPPPTLDDTLRLLDALGMGLNLEIKRHHHSPQQIVDKSLAAIAETRFAGHRLLISSFDQTILARCLLHAPHLRRGLICENLEFDWRATAKQLELFSLHPEWHLLTCECITAIKQQELRIYTWTVNASANVARLWSCGLDGIISDCPHTLPPPGQDAPCAEEYTP